jgi:hypothetical protein
LSSANSGRSWSAASRNTGQLSQTKYVLQNLPPRVTVSRRHHPLYGRELEVLKADRAIITIRLPDGSAMKIPRAWTDSDGSAVCVEPLVPSVFTIEAVRELIHLVDALHSRE